jgi:hypothetical protein
MSPLVGGSSPTATLKEVVFPAPLTPRSPTHSPLPTANQTSLTACTGRANRPREYARPAPAITTCSTTAQQISKSFTQSAAMDFNIFWTHTQTHAHTHAILNIRPLSMQYLGISRCAVDSHLSSQPLLGKVLRPLLCSLLVFNASSALKTRTVQVVLKRSQQCGLHGADTPQLVQYSSTSCQICVSQCKGASPATPFPQMPSIVVFCRTWRP